MNARLLGLLLLSLAAFAGCSRGAVASGNADVALTVSPSPPAVGPARLQVQLSSTQGAPIAGARLQVRGDMTHAGMQPVFANCQDQGNGHYVATGFNFDMAGDWILTVSGTLPDGGVVEQQFPVNGVSGAGTPTPFTSTVAGPSSSPTGS